MDHGPDGRQQVRRPVPSGLGDRPHRAAEGHGLGARERQVEQVGGLFQGVSAVGEDDPIDAGVREHRRHPVLEPPHPVGRDLRPGEAGVILEREPGLLFEPGHL